MLVTHGITYLPNVDNIYVMKDGEISESGTYQELMAKKGSFAEFLIQHLQEVNEEEEDIEEITKQLDSSVVSEDLKGKFKRAISLSRTDSVSETR